MIQTSAAMRILVAIQPVDFRKGIDGLAAVCGKQLGEDPLSGWAFVFRNRRAIAVKILLYDGQGFWLAKRQRGRRRVRAAVDPRESNAAPAGLVVESLRGVGLAGGPP